MHIEQNKRLTQDHMKHFAEIKFKMADWRAFLIVFNIFSEILHIS